MVWLFVAGNSGDWSLLRQQPQELPQQLSEQLLYGSSRSQPEGLCSQASRDWHASNNQSCTMCQESSCHAPLGLLLVDDDVSSICLYIPLLLNTGGTLLQHMLHWVCS